LQKWIGFFLISFLLLFPLISCGQPSAQPVPTAPKTSAAPAGQNSQTTQQPSLKITEPADESVVKTDSVSLSGTVPVNAEVTVNGISVAVEKGNFTAMVELEEGPNSLEIRASDGKGYEETRILNIVYLP
jgi:hypothetical protein